MDRRGSQLRRQSRITSSAYFLSIVIANVSIPGQPRHRVHFTMSLPLLRSLLRAASPESPLRSLALTDLPSCIPLPCTPSGMDPCSCAPLVLHVLLSRTLPALPESRPLIGFTLNRVGSAKREQLDLTTTNRFIPRASAFAVASVTRAWYAIPDEQGQ